MKHSKNKYIAVFSIALFAMFTTSGLGFVLNNKSTSIGTSSASAQEPADINNDNKVDIFDLSILP